MSDKIAVTHVKQSNTNLCWAACCEMLSRRYGSAVNQATFELRHNALFQHGINVQASPQECVHLLRELVPGMYPESLGPPVGNGVVALPTIKRIIGQCRLIIAGRNGHDYVICGWGSTPQDVNFLWAHDPAADSGPVRVVYEGFCVGWTTSVIVDDGVFAID